MKKTVLAILVAFSILLCACGAMTSTVAETPVIEQEARNLMLSQLDELQIKSTDDAYRTSYQVFVYSFCDSDGDGIGDIPGLISKLDYIGDEGLGCDQIWTLPLFPSPTYHKYDVTDYCAIDAQYGTMADFERLVEECHQRGMRLIIDLPINHSCSEHPWFKAACDYLRSLPEGAEPSAEDCPYYGYYNFSDHQLGGYSNVSGTGYYYEARFTYTMPDLNLDSAAVRAEIENILRFWLDKGVDGFRLDAVTSFYTNNKNESIEFLRWLVDTAKGIKSDCYLVGEVWADQSAYAQYLASGIDSVFDFQFAGDGGIICSVVRGTRSASAYAEALENEETLYASYNADYINAPFYTNHDMARSAGYYAGDDGKCVKLAGALNLLMTGDSFTYYGEELGMRGSGKDENKRAPMYWSADSSSEGMCAGPKDMEDVKMKFPALDEQQSDPWSIYNYFRTAIHIRRALPVIARGSTEYIEALSAKEYCAFTRTDDTDSLLICVNTSKEAQTLNIGESAPEYAALRAVLTVDDKEIELIDGVLTLPPFAIAILSK